MILKIFDICGDPSCIQIVDDLLVVSFVHVRGRNSHDLSSNLGVLRQTHIIHSSVKHWRVVILISDLYFQGADILQLRPTIIRSFDGYVNSFLSIWFVSIEYLKKQTKGKR